jgi:hypothetical protein
MARDVRETARKLQRLASSPNEHEAARALEKFQEFTTRHQLRPKDLLPRSHAARMAFYQEQQRMHLAWVDEHRAAIRARYGAKVAKELIRRMRWQYKTTP